MDKVTAGRDAMSKFAPKFAELNDDVLFGEVWSREDKLSPATEMSEALTQLAFYAGWPKAWAALRMAKDVYGEE